MTDTPERPPCETRTAIMTKEALLGMFFLHTGDKNVLWTFDPRLTPQYYYFEYQTGEIAIERFDEMVSISKQNGWTVAFNGKPNNARMS